jgi:hypothetical protein
VRPRRFGPGARNGRADALDWSWPAVLKRCTKGPAPQEIFLPDSIHYKLGRLLARKKRRGESLAPEAPLFVSLKGNRLQRAWRGLHSAVGNNAPAWIPTEEDLMRAVRELPC